MIKSKKQMFIVIGAFALVLTLLSVTYAFFNYTRTGTANVIKTGRINFNAEQDGTVTLSDLFPITVSGTVTSETPGVGSLSIHVTGDTTYEEGIEYLIKAVNVTDTNGANLPISISIGYEASEGQGKTIGTEDEDYFDNRGGATSRYKVLSNNTITEGQDIVVGYIAPGQTGIDGNLIIMAYLDAQNIAITDTNPEELTDTNNDGYIDGTTDTWVAGRTVFTTQEWNALQASGVSFQVKVEANEGVWVEEPIPTIETCPGCKFMYTTSNYQYGGASNVNATEVANLPAGLVKDDYNDVISSSGKNYFLGFTESNGKIDRAFACGIKGEDPNNGTVFCIEGSPDGSTYSANNSLLRTLYGLRDYGIDLGCLDGGYDIDCNGAVGAFASNNYNKTVSVRNTTNAGCAVYGGGTFTCFQN